MHNCVVDLWMFIYTPGSLSRLGSGDTLRHLQRKKVAQACALKRSKDAICLSHSKRKLARKSRGACRQHIADFPSSPDRRPRPANHHARHDHIRPFVQVVQFPFVVVWSSRPFGGGGRKQPIPCHSTRRKQSCAVKVAAMCWWETNTTWHFCSDLDAGETYILRRRVSSSLLTSAMQTRTTRLRRERDRNIIYTQCPSRHLSLQATLASTVHPLLSRLVQPSHLCVGRSPDTEARRGRHSSQAYLSAYSHAD